MIAADTHVQAALDDLHMGRFAAARDLLARTGANWPLRGQRSLLLARGDHATTVRAWLAEEPSGDAAMLWARVLSEKAVDAKTNRACTSGQFDGVARLAWKACLDAAQMNPHDPVPWICQLRLLQLFDDVMLEKWRWQPLTRLADPTMNLRGPWQFLEEADRRAPGSREAYHRMREYFHCQGPESAPMAFSTWLVSGRLSNPELRMMPLYAGLESYLARHRDGSPGSLTYWRGEQFRHYARQARDNWLALVPPVHHPRLELQDLSLLAYVLSACGEPAWAAFEAMGSRMTPSPWLQVNQCLGRSLDWQQSFQQARAAAYRNRPLPGG
ncbi:hypothetical protein AB0465_37620 [Streptomyces griseoviridis]|uniref:hypothetical protein n=1 Tax=Streptomyces griseoviridis TaxID=45398 RepID=UPI0033EFD553